MNDSRISLRSLGCETWRNFRSAWKVLFAIQGLSMLIGAVVAGPVLALALRGALATSGNRILHDTDILSSLMSPSGLLLGLAVSGLWLALQLLGYGTQLIAAHQTHHGRSPTAIGSLMRMAKRFPHLLALAVGFILHIALVALPFIAVVLLVCWVQLSQKDINYYLEVRPPEFLFAVGFALILLAVMAVLVIRAMIGWAYAMPLLLFGGKGAREARRLSLRHARGRHREIAATLVIWFAANLVFAALVNAPWPPLILWSTDVLGHRLGLLSLVLTILFAFSGGLALLAGLVSQSMLAVANLGLFRRTGLDPGPLPARPGGRTQPLPWKLLPAAAALAAIIGSLFLHRELRDIEAGDDALIIAHRGASDLAPENSLSAIRLAIEAGADWVEIDVQETKHGEVVVYHDRDFMRLGGNPLRVRDATTAQLTQIDIGKGFDPRFAGERPVTLGTVLEFCRDRIGVLIELKFYGDEEKLEERVIELVEAHGMAGQIMVMSLKRESIEKFRNLRPAWKLGLLSTVALGDLARFDVDFLAVNARAASPRLLDRARREGKEVYVWTINEPAQISAMLSRGVDGIITDTPHDGLRVIREREQMNAGERLLVEIGARLGEMPPPSDP